MLRGWQVNAATILGNIYSIWFADKWGVHGKSNDLGGRTGDSRSAAYERYSQADDPDSGQASA